MGAFLESHPWIQFRLNLSKSNPKFWILLGEAKSKCEHIAGVPLRPTTAEELHRIYMAKGIMATTAIEGNTLSEEQVRRRIDKQLPLPPSKEYLGQEIDNVVEACNEIQYELLQQTLCDEIAPSMICHYNQLILRGLPVDEDVIPGEPRRHEVGVGRYKAPPARECHELLERLCRFLNEDFSRLEIDSTIRGLLKAIVGHLYIAWIHPFGDGNGRTARLLEYQILLSSGIPTPAAHLLSNHYNATRHEYYRQLDRTSQSGGDILPFLEYAIQGFVDGLREQLAIIQDQQWDVVWRNYIHEKFKDIKSKTGNRRRRLALDLSSQPGFVPIGSITSLTPRVAEAYAHKTRKTLIRDIHDLIDKGVVEKSEEGVRAKREAILSFLPIRKMS